MNRTAAAIATTSVAAAVLTSAVVSPVHASQFPACRPAQLHIKLGHERAALGGVRLTVTATDEGPACILSGWPRLGLLDASRNPLHEVTTRTGKAASVFMQYQLSAHLGLEFGSDGAPGAVRVSYLTADGDAARFPGGVALVYGGQLNETGWENGTGR